MADWIVVVDDDSTNLKMAGHILSKHNKRVTAMRSGRALLDYIRGNVPDLILLDIRMPEMDGFETLRKLRELEKEMQIEEIPVIFLTAEDDVNSEMRGFEMGVSDYVKKPFEPEVLVKRIDNILGKQERLLRFQEEATTDQLTGLYNKAAFHEKMASVCQRLTGYFLMIDLDSFKLVNDLYGHAMGDQILIEFAAAVQELLSEDSIIGRIGGDEFAAFSTQVVSESDIMQFTVNLNANFLERAKKLLGANMSIPLGASIGAAYVSGKGTEFEEVFKGADKALYKVKTNGKHGYSIFDYERAEESDGQQVNLRTLGMILSERNIPDSALLLDKDAFIYVYRFVMRYILRYHKKACQLLFTLSPNEAGDNEAYQEACDQFAMTVKGLLRKSDLVMQYRKDQVFVLLTDMKEDAILQVVGNVMRTWEKKNHDALSISYEVEYMQDNC